MLRLIHSVLGMRALPWLAAAVVGYGAGSAGAIAPPPPAFTIGDLYAAPDGSLMVSHAKGIFRSTDDGQSWQRRSEVFGGQFFADPRSGNLYLLNFNSVQRSRDHGATWQQIAALPVDSARDSMVMAFPDGRPVLYARVQGHTPGAGARLEVSRDLGQTWSPIAAPIPVQNCCAEFGAVDGVLWAQDNQQRLFKSHDQGRTWQPVKLPNSRYFSGIFVDADGWIYMNQLLNLDAQGEGDLDARVYRSKDGGAHWERLWFGARARTSDVQLIGIDRKTLYLSCGHAFCRSTDGQTTQRLTDEMFPGTVLRFGRQGVLTVGTDRVYVYRIDEQARRWQTLGRKGLPDPLTGEPSQ